MTRDLTPAEMVRSYRDGPPEYYDQSARDDLQVALWNAGLDLAPPSRHAYLAKFYDAWFRPPFPPLVMLLTVEENRMGDIEIDLVSQRNRRYYEQLLEESRGEYYDPRRGCLVYLQSQAAEEFRESLSRAQLRELEGGWRFRMKMSRDEFDRLFGWSNEIDMGY